MKRDYNLEERIKIIKDFKPDFRSRSWHNDMVLDYKKFKKNHKYSIGKKPTTVENFNPDKITGSSHDNYNEVSWIEMLQNLERFYRLPCHYSGSVEEYVNQQDNIQLIKCGNNYFINGGNHRFCIAKFLEIRIKKVTIKEYMLEL